MGFIVGRSVKRGTQGLYLWVVQRCLFAKRRKDAERDALFQWHRLFPNAERFDAQWSWGIWPRPCPSPHTKFHPNRMKNTEVENFHFWSILVGRAGRSKNGRSHFKHSNAAWKVIKDLCTKFQLNRMKIGQISPFLNFWLVGWLGRSAWAKLETKLWFKAECHD